MTSGEERVSAMFSFVRLEVLEYICQRGWTHIVYANLNILKGLNE